MTGHPWEAEHAVDADAARSMIAECFPALAPGKLEPLGVGWDNTAWLVDDTCVFRFPRREFAANLLDAECAVLPVIASRLPLPVPNPEWIGRCEDRFPWTFAGYRVIPGRTACRARLDDEQRARCAEPLARFLATLHAQPTPELDACGLPDDELDRLDLAKRVAMAEERFAEARGHGLVDDHSLLERMIADLPSEWMPSGSTLVHGDLYARHVLVDDAAAPCGIIDWGDVHRGDPAVDLSIAWGFLPPRARDTFREAYGPIDDDAWRVARFRALYWVYVDLVYAHDVGDEALMREGRVALDLLAR